MIQRNLAETLEYRWCSYVIRVGSAENRGDGPSERSFVGVGCRNCTCQCQWRSDTSTLQFFCCDSGYSSIVFSSIGRPLGPVDAAALPIGSYKPRWAQENLHQLLNMMFTLQLFFLADGLWAYNMWELIWIVKWCLAELIYSISISLEGRSSWCTKNCG